MNNPKNKEDGDLLYLSLALQEWGSLTTNFGLPLNNEAMPDSPGFLPVFNSREAAQREYPGHTICTIRKAPLNEENEQSKEEA